MSEKRYNILFGGKVAPGRDAEEVKRALEALSHAVERNENLMPEMINAVKVYATVGEICDILRQHWGEYRAPTYI